MWAWRAWHRLKDDRQWRGGGMGPAIPCGIPYTAVTAYADRHEQDADALFTIIKAMDRVFIDWWSAEAERQSKR